jgi:hypothetical protein
LGLLNLARAHEILSGVQEELLERVRAGALSERALTGAHRVTFQQLIQTQATLAGTSTEFARTAGMSEAQEAQVGTPLGRLLQQVGEVQQAVTDAERSLPRTTRARLDIRFEVGNGSDQDSDGLSTLDPALRVDNSP